MPPIDLDHIDAWIFDLDNTLYSDTVGYFDQIRSKMTGFISDYLKISHDEAFTIQKQHLAKYGTSLAGLMSEYNMEPSGFLHHVHDVDPSGLHIDTRLHAGLNALSGRKFIFTNGSRTHAKNVGEHLGIYGMFDGVFGIEDADYISKPQHRPYEKFINAFDIEPSRAFMAEDSARNLQVPKTLGMATLLVTPPSQPNTPPHDPDTVPDFVDMHTYDLPAWLLALP